MLTFSPVKNHFPGDSEVHAASDGQNTFSVFKDKDGTWIAHAAPTVKGAKHAKIGNKHASLDDAIKACEAFQQAHK